MAGASGETNDANPDSAVVIVNGGKEATNSREYSGKTTEFMPYVTSSEADSFRGVTPVPCGLVILSKFIGGWQILPKSKAARQKSHKASTHVLPRLPSGLTS